MFKLLYKCEFCGAEKYLTKEQAETEKCECETDIASKIDLTNTWCENTKENYNALINLGLKPFKNLDGTLDGGIYLAIKMESFEETDIMFTNTLEAFKRHFKIKQVHLVNKEFQYIKSVLGIMKKKFDSGNYICVFTKEGNWRGVPTICHTKTDKPKWTEDIKYTLFLKKHEHILDAYLDDNSVEIEYVDPNMLLLSNPPQQKIVKVRNFIEEYNENFDYYLVKTNEEYPQFFETEKGIFCKTGKYDCIWMLHRSSETVGNKFREFTGNIINTIPYNKKRGLYHKQPVWIYNKEIPTVRSITFWDTIESQHFVHDNRNVVEPITPEQLKTMDFVWDMYKKLKDKISGKMC